MPLASLSPKSSARRKLQSPAPADAGKQRARKQSPAPPLTGKRTRSKSPIRGKSPARRKMSPARAKSPAPAKKRARVEQLPPKWAQATAAHRQLLPRETASCPLPRRQGSEAGAWPKTDLFFKRWVDDEADDLHHDVLLERGWEFRGDVANPSKYIAAGQASKTLAEKVRDGTANTPRRCMWLLDLPDAKNICSLPGGAEKHRMNTFVGTEAACFKTSFTNAFRGQDWWPESYALPGDAKQMLGRIGKCGKAGTEYWAVKPKNDFGGSGITVHAPGKDLVEIVSNKESKRYVAQRYLHRPMLIGGYKFHLRVHTLLTSVSPCRAHLHHDGHVMFSTKPYTLDASTLGKNFDGYVHLTNYSLNATEKNKDNFMAPKGIVGPGTMWSLKYLLNYLQKERGVNTDKVWKDIARVSAAIMRHVASYPTVKRGAPGRSYELFGLDMMLDENAKLWVLEGNNSVGIEYCGSHIPEDGIKFGRTYVRWSRRTPRSHPDYFSDEVLRQVCHDMHALLGMDAEAVKKRDCGRADNWVSLDDQ